MGFTRYLLAIPVAAVVTVGLFMLMRFLIEGEKFEIEDPGQKLTVQVTRTERDEESQRDRQQLERPDEPDTPPPPPLDLSAQDRPNVGGVGVTLPDVGGLDFAFGELGAVGTGGPQLLAAVVLYPERARSRGIEGYVIVEFDVTANGQVENIRIVEAKPEGWFEKAAERSVSRWKFKPEVRDGQPVATKGVRKQVTFRLEK